MLSEITVCIRNTIQIEKCFASLRLSAKKQCPGLLQRNNSGNPKASVFLLKRYIY